MKKHGNSPETHLCVKLAKISACQYFDITLLIEKIRFALFILKVSNRNKNENIF